MSVFEFRDPWIHKAVRRCRECRQLVEVICCGGATMPSEAHYRCSNCLDVPEATEAAIEQARPQLQLVEGEGRG